MTYPRPESPPALREKASPGCYVYCVAPRGQGGLLDLQGIEGAQLSVVAHQDLAAVVQEWHEEIAPQDKDRVAAWALAHHRVVEVVWRQRGAVVPLAFPTVFRVPIGDNGEEPVRRWLEAEEATLMGKLEALAGKAEYSVQVFWDPALVSPRAPAQAVPEGQSPGRAYMERLLLEAAERRAQETRLREQLQELQRQAIGWAERLLVERPRQAAGGSPMLLNLACLLTPDQLPHLASEMEQAKNGMIGLTIRLVGPLPPYSFC